jgi:hypothetical protein
MIRAAKLDDGVYEEVERDPDAMGQAAMIVIGTSILAGIGQLPDNGIGGLIAGMIFALLGWVAFAWVAYFVGTRVFNEPNTHANFGEVARVVGFASSPNVLQVFQIIPLLGPLIGLAASVWVLVATVIGIRAALELPTMKAVLTVIVAGIVLFVVAILIPAIIIGSIFVAAT